MLTPEPKSKPKSVSHLEGSLSELRQREASQSKTKTTGNLANSNQPEQQQAKEVDLVTVKDKPVLKKTTKSGSTSYKYVGPVNRDIQDFLEDLYRREGPVHQRGPLEKLITLNERIDKRLEKIFPRGCTDGPLSLNKDSILLFLVMIAGSIYFSIRIDTATEGMTSESMQVLRKFGALYVFTFTIYGFVYLSLPLMWALIVLFIQSLIPTFLILFDYNLIFKRDNVPDVDVTNTAIRICAGILPVFWIMIYPVYKLAKYYIGRFTSHVIVGALYVGVVLFAVGVPALNLVTGEETLDVAFFYNHSDSIVILTAIFVSFSWIIAHVKYFWVPTSVLESTLMQMAQKQAKKESRTKSPDVVRDGIIAVPTKKERFMRNLYWMASLIIGGIYIGMEMYLLNQTISSLETDSIEGLVMSVLFFLAIPMFLMIGLPIAMAKIRAKNKTLLVPLVVMVPMFFLIPLAQAFEEVTDTDGFTLIVMIGPPVVIFFWLAMAFYNLKKRRLLYLVTTFMCVFFFLPFVFLGLSESDFYASTKDGLRISFYTFIGILGTVTLVLLFWRSFKSLRLYFKGKLNELRRQKKKQKEIQERLKALRKQKLERIKAREEGGIYNDEDIEDEEDDDLEMEELERMEREGAPVDFIRKPTLFKGRRNTIFPSHNDLDSKKGSRNDLDSRGHISNRNAPKANEDEFEDDAENKAKKQLNILKDVEKKRRMKLVRLMYLNFKNFGYWINAAAFIVSYTFVAYTYFNMASTTTSTEAGILLGVTIVIPIIFVLNNLIIRLKTAKLSAEERKVYSLKKEPERKFFESQLKRDETRLEKATVIEVYILLMGVLLIPLMQIPLFIVFTDRSSFITNLFFMFISIFFSLFLAGMIELKKKTGPHNRFFVPSFIAICWIMIILPFVVAIPLVSAVLENDTDEYEIFVQTSFTGSAFILMFCVTFFAIIINILFQKLEKEKLIKFIVKKLQRVLKEHSMKADDVVVRRLVEEYLKLDTEEEITALKDGVIFDHIPLVPLYPPKFKVTPNFGAAILLVETYTKILRAQQLKKEKNEKNPKKAKKEKEKDQKDKLTLFAKLAACCTDKEIEEAIEENFDEDHIEDIVAEKEDSYFKADHYLPMELGDNVWNIAAGHYTPEMLNHTDNITNLTDYNDVLEEYHPVLGLKPTEVDFKLKDAMTPILERIAVKPLAGGEERKLNSNEHALIIHESINQMEVWYQHVYDYFSGKSEPETSDNLSQGMIYQNFQNFLRVTELNQKNEFSRKDIENMFSLNATKKAEKGCCLGYNGFIQILTEIAAKTVSEGNNDSKLLKKFTKKIYPAIMSRIPSIAKSYSGAIISFSKSKTPYEPQLSLFDKNRMISVTQENGDVSSETLGKKQMLKHNVHILRQIREEPYTKQLSNVVQRNFANKSPKSQGMLSSESLLLNGDKSPISKDKPKNKLRCSIKKICRNMFLALNVCWLSFTSKIGRCMTATFVRNPKLLGDWVYKKTKRVGKALGFAIDEESDHEDEIIRRVTNEAPSWPIIIDKIFSIIPKAQILYFQKQGEKGISLQFNMTNLIAIVGKIGEIYGFMAFAFRTEIPWFEEDTPSDVILATNVEVTWWKTFVFLFWLAVGLVVIYLMISIPAIYYLRKGTLGQDIEGKKASFPHPQFFLTFAVTILGGSLFTQIMRFLMEAYVCDFTTEPWVLMKDDSIECLSDEHALYMGIGILALLIYYPISTFMFPNFQFQSAPLDLKYDPSYVVIQIQARLIITGFISFLKVSDPSDTTPILIQLIGCATVLFLLALASIILKPCLIRKANIWDAASYFASSWVNICAIVVVIEGDGLVGAIMLGIGTLVILTATVFVIRKYYGTKSKKKKNNDLVITYDPVKRQALVPIEQKPAAVQPDTAVPNMNDQQDRNEKRERVESIPEKKAFLF